MRLNSKGMTTVEILMVFVIIGIISVGLFSMVSTYNTLQNTESAKEKVSEVNAEKIIQDVVLSLLMF